jgi:hypothetical protein
MQPAVLQRILASSRCRPAFLASTPNTQDTQGG